MTLDEYFERVHRPAELALANDVAKELVVWGPIVTDMFRHEGPENAPWWARLYMALCE